MESSRGLALRRTPPSEALFVLNRAVSSANSVKSWNKLKIEQGYVSQIYRNLADYGARGADCS